ncbi:uncharacterized protein BKA55DRAFT_567223 [Fusarium redolens]|uniref:C2H2-type domain-containing protein n=1 Tax=Fusarium redolens TaxID=48865 RepID=A0A9P9HAZ3_FUSRE|nr:uncharacterized protein BKA55DRAFT_567223 [Fusarium redolens]KAH7254221.1 hypothetical protein BKA55DRAFT_567223 [Fusarium redolens]
MLFKMSSCGFSLFYILFQHLKSCFRRNKVEAIGGPNCCQHHDFQQPYRRSTHTGETKRASAGQCDPWLHNSPNAPLHWCAAPLSPRHDMESQCRSPNDTEDEKHVGDFSSSEHKLISTDDFQSQRLEVKTHALAVFKDWKERMEYITPPENGLLPQQRLKPSLGQTYDEYDISDDDLAVISRPTRYFRAPFHLACPFYVYDPEKCHQCLLTSDLRSTADVIEHLFKFHSRPCCCLNCYETFDTQIRRDDHVLKEKCQERTPGPLFGLSESQKSMLLETDTHCNSEKTRWLCIWSIVFPDSREPVSPYLGQGSGLAVSMMRDFWDLYGSKCILNSLKHQRIPRYEHQSLMGNLYELVLEDLLISA